MLKSTSAAAAGGAVIGDAGLVAGLDELAVRRLQQQVVRVLRGEVRHLVDVALGDEQVDEAVIVHVVELGMPGGAGPKVVAGIGAVRGHALGIGDVLVVRLGSGPGGSAASVCSLLSAMLVRKYSG